MIHFTLLAVAIGFPIFGAAIRGSVPDRVRWYVGALASTGTWLVLVTVAGGFWCGAAPFVPTSGAWYSRVLEGNSPMLALSLAIASGFGVFHWIAPRRLRRARSERALLLVEALALSTLFVQDLRTLFVLWNLVPLPLWLGWRPAKSAYFVGQLLAGLSFLVAVLVLPDFDLHTLAIPGASPENLRFVGALICLAAFLRQGLFPFHSALLGLTERMPMDSVAALLLSQSGLVLLMRVGIPLMRSVLVVYHLGLMILALAGLTYAALLAAGRTEPRRLVACLALADASLVLVGIASGDPLGYVGAGLHWVVSTLVISGLAGTLWLLELRTGRVEPTGGLAKAMPALAGLFLVFSLAGVHVPLTLGFVSEDLLVHGLLDHSVLLGILVLLMMLVLGVSVARTFFATFLGQPRRLVQVPDLRRRERAALLLPFLLLVAFGVAPNALVQRFERSIAELGAWNDVGSPGEATPERQTGSTSR